MIGVAIAFRGEPNEPSAAEGPFVMFRALSKAARVFSGAEAPRFTIIVKLGWRIHRLLYTDIRLYRHQTDIVGSGRRAAGRWGTPSGKILPGFNLLAGAKACRT